MQLVLISLMLVIFSAAAYSAEDEFAEAKNLVDAKTPCSQLSESQTELIGDYYMEQMHPGEAHELMHKMMGGEDSEFVKLMHINMAKSIYCGEQNQGMMEMMNMMGGQNAQSSMMQGMMGNNPIGFSYNYWGFWNVVWLLFWIGIIVLIVWAGIFLYLINNTPEKSILKN